MRMYLHMYVQSSLFTIPSCELAHSVKFVCNPHVNTRGALAAICGHGQSGKKCESLTGTAPAEVKQGDTCFSSHTVKLGPFSPSHDCHGFLHFCVFFLLVVILLFKMALQM